MAQLVKNLPAMWGTLVPSLGWEDPLEKGKVTHASILAWGIPELYSPLGHKELDMIEQLFCRGFPCSSLGKKSACNAGGLGSIPQLGRSPGEGNGNPLQYSGLENPIDRGAWWATVHGVVRIVHNLATKPPIRKELGEHMLLSYLSPGSANSDSYRSKKLYIHS